MPAALTQNDYEILESENYNFLDSNKHLGDNIELLYIGGSRAYGLNDKESDYDLRGFALLTDKDYYLMKDFEQVENKTTDSVVYSFIKFVKLLRAANPNILEVFDAPVLKGGHVWTYIKDNQDIFLSKRAIKTFQGYALQQQRRLENLMNSDPEYSIYEAPHAFRRFSKYECNCVRSLRMGVELLTTGEVHTYRDKDKEELRELREGKMVALIEGNGVASVHPRKEFFLLLDKELKKFWRAKDNCILPDNPNDDKINELLINVAEHCIGDNIIHKFIQQARLCGC